MFSMFNEYRGLRKELYVIAFGRMMTSMGSIIMPMLSFILTNKMGKTASQVALVMLVYSLLQVPGTLIGGRLADKFSKRNMIIICDFITIFAYLTAGFIPLSELSIVFLLTGAVFARVEWPSYDALVADLTSSNDRAKAYSLNYLAGNLGFVLAPIVGGILFESHLNLAFFISAFATLSSTMLIIFFVKNTTKEIDLSNTYEHAQDGLSVFALIKQRKLLILFIICGMFSSFIYRQWEYLLPINLEQIYGVTGAEKYGYIASLNGAVVIICTPIFTKVFRKLKEVSKVVVGETLIVLALGMNIFIQGNMPLYFVFIVIFTFGEVFTTLGKQPYLTRRIPSSHRGRIASINLVTGIIFQSSLVALEGTIVDKVSMQIVWSLVFAVGILAIILYVALRHFDKIQYKYLYEDSIADALAHNQN